MLTKTPSASLACLLSLLLVVGSCSARPYKDYQDSPIKTIVVPYQSNAIGYPYKHQFPATESRHVLVPQVMQMVPNFGLDQGAMAMGSSKGAAVNFAEGAYPVYYMPSNVNGRFNGKISLLQ